MLIKLEHYGIRGTTLELLTNYLKNREQITNFKGIDSGIKRKVNFGVTEGSVVGPLLFLPFLLYIHDIDNSSADGAIVLFILS